MKINPADKVERWPIEKLVPYARNARTHSPEQVAQIAASIREWGWTVPLLVDTEGGIIAGHGRLMAAQRLSMTQVPVMVADGWTDAQKRAYVLADNKLTLNGGWDNELLSLELADLQEAGFDLALTGLVRRTRLGRRVADQEAAQERFASDHEARGVDGACGSQQQQDTRHRAGPLRWFWYHAHRLREIRPARAVDGARSEVRRCCHPSMAGIHGQGGSSGVIRRAVQRVK